MDAASALADLTEISSQVEAAVVLDHAGAVIASTLEDPERSALLARAAVNLLGAADKRFETGGRALTQLEAALREGSVFVVREEGRSIVAKTSPQPTSGLVFYDLKTCLRSLAEPELEPKSESEPKSKPEPERSRKSPSSSACSRSRTPSSSIRRSPSAGQSAPRATARSCSASGAPLSSVTIEPSL